jgi:hypothetical protein
LPTQERASSRPLRSPCVGGVCRIFALSYGAAYPPEELHFRPMPVRRRTADPRAPVRRGPSRCLPHQIRPVARAQVRMSKRSTFIVHISRTPCHEATQKTGEALGSYGCVRRKVASAPPFGTTGIIAPPPLFDSPATSQLGRRPLSFAPPPHDRFALLASAHGYARLLAHFQCLLSMHHTLNPRATQYSR